MSFHIMEEHLQAYYVWKASGLKNAWCWHIDAHLDIGKTGLFERRLEKVASSRNTEELRAQGGLGNSYLPWGGLHCGNYLYPAIREGIVSRLTWVYPPYLPEGKRLTWARHHLNQWFDLSLKEYAELREEDGRVVGTLVGIPFEMGTLESLQIPEQEVVLDLDLDYLLTEDGELWRSSEELLQGLKGLRSTLTTAAFSVKGGFTPESGRELVEPLREAWGEPKVCEEPRHCWSELDTLAAKVRCHQHQEALSLAEELPRSVEREFLKGTSLQALELKEEALGVWESLLENFELPDDGRAYLHGLAAEILAAGGQGKRALEHCRAAQKTKSGDYRHLWNEAIAREAVGEDRKALKVLRKLVKETEHLLFGLKARYALARVYQAQGKDGLAKLEMQKLAALDVTGQFRSATLLHS